MDADLLAPYVTDHVGVDHPNSPHALTSVDILPTAYDIPAESASFDTALLSEVLEHLEQPLLASRVLAASAAGRQADLDRPVRLGPPLGAARLLPLLPRDVRWLLEQAGFVNIKTRGFRAFAKVPESRLSARRL